MVATATVAVVVVAVVVSVVNVGKVVVTVAVSVGVEESVTTMIGVARAFILVVLAIFMEGVIDRQEQAVERRAPRNWERSPGTSRLARGSLGTPSNVVVKTVLMLI